MTHDWVRRMKEKVLTNYWQRRFSRGGRGEGWGGVCDRHLTGCTVAWGLETSPNVPANICHDMAAVTSPVVERTFGLKADEVPEQFREVFICTRYRKPYVSLSQCLRSAFQASNETVNVWSHFVPFLLFVARFCHFFYKSNPTPYEWPLVSFAIGACGFCLMSSGAHLLNCMSPRIRHICFYFDYAAISVYSIGAGQAFFFYGRPLRSNIVVFNSAALFLSISIAASFLSTFVCCASRHRWVKVKYIVRTGSFIASFLYNSAPYFYRLALEEADNSQMVTADLYFKRHVLFYLVSALANMSKFPERLFPEVFDFVGQSHHFLHVFTALGTADLFTSLQMQSQARRKSLMADEIASFSNSLGLMLFAFGVNVGIVLWFGQNLKSDKEEERKTC